MAKRKKIKIKKQGYFIIGIFIILIIGTFYGIKTYKNYLYEQTNEYKISTKGYSLDETKEMLGKIDEDVANKIILFLKKT